MIYIALAYRHVICYAKKLLRPCNVIIIAGKDAIPGIRKDLRETMPMPRDLAWYERREDGESCLVSRVDIISPHYVTVNVDVVLPSGKSLVKVWVETQQKAWL